MVARTEGWRQGWSGSGNVDSGAQDVLMDGRGGGRGRGIQDASVRGGGGTAQGPGAEFCAGVAEGVSA